LWGKSALNVKGKGQVIFDFASKYVTGQKYEYQVFEKKIVEANQIEYLKNNLWSTRGSTPTERILTLMTCWPAGTNLKRLIVVALLK